MNTVGLTGGIGCGKSTVSNILARLGAFVIDADKVGHDIYLPGTEAWQKVVGRFGQEILANDETIDRKRLATIVFGTDGMLEELNAIVHPIMYKEIEKRILSLRANGTKAPVIVEAAILIEAKWTALADIVWVVETDKAAVVDRVSSQRGMSPNETEARISKQLSNRERREHAHLVIRNNGTVEDLEREVSAAWDTLSV